MAAAGRRADHPEVQLQDRPLIRGSAEPGIAAGALAGSKPASTRQGTNHGYDTARTSFGAEDQAAYFAVITRVARPFMKTRRRGAVTPIYLASSPEVEGVRGEY